jgi:osmoprotectant transport system permease protein
VPACEAHNRAVRRRPALPTLLACLAGFAALLCAPCRAADAPTRTLVVGSKRFTESYLLGELATQALQRAGIAAEHRQGLGNTAILAGALESGAIDLYPEYTGTIARELLKREADGPPPSLDQLNQWLAPRGWKAAVPLGFNNTYALAMREDDAARLGVDSISSLAKLPAAQAASLRFGLSHEFLQRADGWPGLKKAYALPFTPPSGLDHGLAYQAIAQRQVDIIDVYSTDAQIGRLKLRVLRDDKGFFPRYDAVLLMRASLPSSAVSALQSALQGRIDERTMIRLNAEAELDGRPFAEAARGFLSSKPADAAQAARSGFRERLFAPDLGRLLAQHLAMVFGSLALAVVVGVPLGIAAFRWRAMAGVLMGAVGVLQTIPSLALLAFLIALVGTIGFVPALLALFVYALLPIVRNTHAGLASVSPGLRLAAQALGLRPSQVLRSVELPLAAPTLMAGIKTAAVINVGTATVAAFVGAGGLGERIVSGLALNDSAQTLAGAVPAAVLALLVQAVFDFAERLVRRTPSAALDTRS